MSPAPMPLVTAFYAGLVALVLLFLAARISLFRRRFSIGLGDGGNKLLSRAIRAHGNAVEWGIASIVLLLIVELNRAPASFVHACGIAIVLGRVLHAAGLSRTGGYSFGRFVGSAVSWTAFAALGGFALWAFVRTLLV